MSSGAFVTQTIDWFIPSELLNDREMRTRARMFLFSHLFGPILGNVIPGMLLFADPTSAPTLAVLAGSICCFWLFPFALKISGRYENLSYLSIQNLLFAILWGCYWYGGLSSPFLPWLVTVPLLAFFYLGASLKSCALILVQFTISLTIFMYQFYATGSFPASITRTDLQIIGLVSIVSAAIYVSMMALYYARILASQVEFEKEVSRHIETAIQLREAAAQADRANAAKADFLAKMSHELRTPLNAVIGYSQILLEDTDPELDAQGVEDLTKIHDAGHHLLGLVNAILDLSKIEAGKMETFPSEVDLVVLLNGLATRTISALGETTRQVTVKCDASCNNVNVDAGKLEQILNMLIDNAVRHAPQSDIEVRADASTDADGRPSIDLCVCDFGPGIPDSLQPTLFDTFSDRDEVNSKKFGGPGLGLPLSHRLSNLIGGELSVKSSGHNGTVVRLRLPTSEDNQLNYARSDPTLAKAA